MNLPHAYAQLSFDEESGIFDCKYSQKFTQVYQISLRGKVCNENIPVKDGPSYARHYKGSVQTR
jgi:hypothetical protein